MKTTLIMNWGPDDSFEEMPPGVKALLESANADLRETAKGSVKLNVLQPRTAESMCGATLDSRHKAAQAWQHPTTSGTVLDPALAEAFALILDEEKARMVGSFGKESGRVEQERDNWIETCAQQARDIAAYQKTLDRLGLLFGEEAFTCEDGSRSDEVLRAKVPELVEGAVKELWGHRQREANARDLCCNTVDTEAPAPVDTRENLNKCSCSGSAGVLRSLYDRCTKCGLPTM